MTVLRLYAREEGGRFEDLKHEMDLSECGGVCPAPGDHIMASWSGETGMIWDVKGRYFKAKGFEDYIVLIVEEREARPDEIDLF